MNIHEYQAKAILREFGVAVPHGVAAFSVPDAEKAANELGGPVWVVKAQIHAGGRGKAGGVKVVKSVAEAKREAERMLGSVLVTHQTGPAGRQVRRVYIEEGSAIDREYYLSALVDRDLARRLRRLDRRRHGHRRGRAQGAGQDRQLFNRSGDRLHAPSCAPRRASLRLRPQPDQASRGHAAEALPRVRGKGHEPA